MRMNRRRIIKMVSTLIRLLMVYPASEEHEGGFCGGDHYYPWLSHERSAGSTRVICVLGHRVAALSLCHRFTALHTALTK